MKIFLSYRREDASGHAGRLYDVLVRRYGAEQVFMDIDAIPVGSQFGEEIHRAVASCDVFIALIGPRWAHVADSDGGRRLDDADDYLRREIESALASDVRVVPVCVQGADLPPADVLPPSLAPLVERQGTKLSDASWHDDVERLVRRLEGRPPPRRNRTLLLAAVAGALALAGVAIALALQDDGEPSLNESEQRLVSSITGAAAAPDACSPKSETAPEADASVSCGPAARVVSEYHQFPTPEAAQRWFAQAELSAGGAGDCAPERFGEPVRAPAAGQFCDDQAGEPHLFYLDEAARIGVEAHVNDIEGRDAINRLLTVRESAWFRFQDQE
ncbi:toll/interleukin-1 receptor domain-containing protein [Solirubrobacter taibaiensis]|nr:toll/interleukin-1 receptor domain-containing protein [Solirubrobacter taibaiensis]